MEQVQQELEIDEQVAPLAERFSVKDRESAEWVLRKLYSRKKEAELLAAQAARIVKDANERLAAFEARFAPELEAWAAQELERQGGRGKTVKTFAGDIGFRTVPPTLVFPTSEQEMLLLAGVYAPEAVSTETVVTTKIDKRVLKKAILDQIVAGDEIPEGVEFVSSRETMTIKFAVEDSKEDAS
jgi:hypothetical protein